MAFQKGQSGNPAGKSAYEKRLLERVRKAGIRAVDKLIETMDADDQRLSFDAAKYVYEVLMGKPKVNATLDVTHELGPAASHAVALTALTKMTTPHLNPSADTNPLISLENMTASDKLSINHAPIIDAEIVPIEPDISDDKPKSSMKSMAALPAVSDTPPPRSQEGC